MRSLPDILPTTGNNYRDRMKVHHDQADPHGGFRNVAADASAEADHVPVELLGDYLAALSAASDTRRRLDAAQVASCRASGRRAAESGIPLGMLIDLYLSATWRVWRQLPAVRRARSATSVVSTAEVVLRVADDAVAAVAAGYDEARDSAVRQQEAQRHEFVEDLLSSTSDVTRLVERAARFGLHLAGRHAVSVVDGLSLLANSSDAAARIERTLAERLKRRRSARILVTIRSGRLICVYAEEESRSQRSTRSRPDPAEGRVAAALIRTLRSEAPDDAWRIGIGRSYAGPGGVSHSFAEAIDALDVSARLREPGQVVRAADLLVYQVISRDREALVDLVNTVLGPLAAARGGAGPLVDTLAGYFAVGAVATDAARRLHVSVRTVTYRLARIKALTGYDVSQPAERFALQTAALGAQIIGWPAG